MKTVKIGIADDNIIYRNGLSDLLNRLNYTVTIVASNGKELIEQIEQTIAKPDICIIDVEMPVMNGFEATAILKNRWPFIKVIGHSLNNELSVLTDMMDNGAEKFVAKGLPVDLQNAIEELVNQLSQYETQ